MFGQLELELENGLNWFVIVDNFGSAPRNRCSKIVHWTIKVVDRIMYLVDNIHYCLDNLKA